VPLSAIIAAALVVFAVGFVIWRRGRPVSVVTHVNSEAEVEAIAGKVRQWLNEGASRGRT
jgi:ABC-type Fe3+-siderophore transport system permease subunit